MLKNIQEFHESTENAHFRAGFLHAMVFSTACWSDEQRSRVIITLMKSMNAVTKTAFLSSCKSSGTLSKVLKEMEGADG